MLGFLSMYITSKHIYNFDPIELLGVSSNEILISNGDKDITQTQRIVADNLESIMYT